MNRSCVLLLVALLPPPAHAEGGFGLSGMFRSLTNALGGPRETETKAATATIGVRGMDEGNVEAAAPAQEELRLLESWSASRIEAENAARKRGLVAKTASFGEVTSPRGEAR